MQPQSSAADPRTAFMHASHCTGHNALKYATLLTFFFCFFYILLLFSGAVFLFSFFPMAILSRTARTAKHDTSSSSSSSLHTGSASVTGGAGGRWNGSTMTAIKALAAFGLAFVVTSLLLPPTQPEPRAYVATQGPHVPAAPPADLRGFRTPVDGDVGPPSTALDAAPEPGPDLVAVTAPVRHAPQPAGAPVTILQQAGDVVGAVQAPQLVEPPFQLLDACPPKSRPHSLQLVPGAWSSHVRTSPPYSPLPCATAPSLPPFPNKQTPLHPCLAQPGADQEGYGHVELVGGPAAAPCRVRDHPKPSRSLGGVFKGQWVHVAGDLVAQKTAVELGRLLDGNAARNIAAIGSRGGLKNIADVTSFKKGKTGTRVSYRRRETLFTDMPAHGRQFAAASPQQMAVTQLEMLAKNHNFPDVLMVMTGWTHVLGSSQVQKPRLRPAAQYSVSRQRRHAQLFVDRVLRVSGIRPSNVYWVRPVSPAALVAEAQTTTAGGEVTEDIREAALRYYEEVLDAEAGVMKTYGAKVINVEAVTGTSFMQDVVMKTALSLYPAQAWSMLHSAAAQVLALAITPPKL